MTQSRSPRRTPAQWRDLLDQWQHSGLPARQFCTEYAIGYASFCKWRRRLAETQAGGQTAAKFIGLSALPGPASAGWHIVVHLGDGVEIRFDRH